MKVLYFRLISSFVLFLRTFDIWFSLFILTFDHLELRFTIKSFWRGWIYTCKETLSSLAAFVIHLKISTIWLQSLVMITIKYETCIYKLLYHITCWTPHSGFTYITLTLKCSLKWQQEIAYYTIVAVSTFNEVWNFSVR